MRLALAIALGQLALGCHLLLPNTAPSPTADATTDVSPKDGFACTSEFPSPPPEPSACNSTGWCWVLPANGQTNTLHDIWAISNAEAVAFGTYGTVIHYGGPNPMIESIGPYTLTTGAVDDLGKIYTAGEGLIASRDAAGWEIKTLDPDVTLRDMYAGTGSESVVFAIGQSPSGPIVYRRTVTDWVEVVFSFATVGSTLEAIDGAGDYVRVVGQDRLLWEYESGSWSEISPSFPFPPDTHFTAVKVFGPDLAYVGTAEGKLFRDVGGTYSEVSISCPTIPCTSIIKLSAVSTNELLILYGNGRAQLYNTVNGTTLNLPEVPDPAGATQTKGFFRSGAVQDNSVVVVVGSAGRVARYQFGDWHDDRGPPYGAVLDGREFTASGGPVHHVVGDNFVGQRLGDVWRFGAYFGATVTGFWGFDACQGWATSHTDMLRLENGTWRIAEPHEALAGQGVLWDIWAADEKSIFVSGDGGVWHWDGTGWTHIYVAVPNAPGARISLTGIWGTAEDRVIAVGLEVSEAVQGDAGPMATDAGSDVGIGDAGSASSRISGRVWHCDATGCIENTSESIPFALYDVWGEGDQFVAVGTGMRYVKIDGQQVTAHSTLSSPTLSPPTMLRLTGRSINELWAATDNGQVAHFNGQNWLLEQTVTSNPLFSVWLNRDGTKLYAGGAHGSLISKALP